MDAVQNYLSTMEPEARSRAYTWHGPRKPEQLMIRVTDDLKDEVFDSPGGSGSLELGGEGWMEGGINEGKLDTQKDDMNMKKPNSRRNAWGCMSYADLIARAIESVPERRLTLSQIYDWMIQNVPYFRDKGESSSSAGWKNSIRHNLSLHRRFTRVQNEGTGKSSWWIINEEANTPMAKSPRRRATSMDTRTFEKKRLRLKKKAATDEINSNTGDKYSGVGVITGGGEAFLEDAAGYQIANTLARHSTSSDGSPFCWPGGGDGLTESGRFGSGEGVFPDGVYVGYSGLYQGATPDVGSVTFNGSPDNIKPFYETSYATQLTPLHNLKYLDCQTTVTGGIDLNANDTLQFQNTTPLPPASILLPLTSPSGSTPHQQNIYRYDSLQSTTDILSDGNFQVENPSYQTMGYSEIMNSPLRFPTGAEVQFQSQPMTTNRTKGSVLRQMLSQGPMTTGGIFSSISGSGSGDSKYAQEKVDIAPGFSSVDSGSGEYRQYMKLEKMTPILECGEEKQSDFNAECRYDPSISGPDSISTGYSGCQEELGTNSNIYQYDYTPASFTNNYSHMGDVRNAVIGYDHASSIQPPTAIGYSPDVYSNRLESSTLNSDRLCSDVMKSSTCKTTLNQAVAVESSDQSSCLEMDYINAPQNRDLTSSVDNESVKVENISDACPMRGQITKENQGVKEEDCPPSCGVAEENWEFNFDLVPNSSTAVSVASPVTSTIATSSEVDATEATSALKVTAVVDTVATPTAGVTSADIAVVT